MTEEELIGVLAAIIAPIVGRFLANAAAQQLYLQLAIADQDALDELIISYTDVEGIE